MPTSILQTAVVFPAHDLCKKLPIGYHLLAHNNHVLKFEKTLQQILPFFMILHFLNSKLGYLMNCMTTQFFGLL